MSEIVSSLFVGEFNYKLDAKNRVSIPATWAIEEGRTLFLQSSKKNNFPMIRVLTVEYFQQLVQTVKESAHAPAKKALLIGKLHSTCVETSINSQGKMLLPKRMVDSCCLDVDVKLVAGDAYFEIWKPELYDESERQLEALYDELNTDLGVLYT